jgi:hypothetical protein
MRADFAQASVGLLLPQQKKNLQRLHDWLIDEQHLPDHERVLALTNYQQGRFGRMPSHIFLVTSRRIAYTHDGGLRSIAIEDVDTSRIGLRAGVGSGDVTVALRNGEELTFRRGITLSMQEVATTLTGLGHGATAPPAPASPPPAAAPAPVNDAGGSDTPGEPSLPTREERTRRGVGGGVVEYAEPITQPMPVAISGSPAGYGIFTVWALDENLAQTSLLVNVSHAYAGVCVIGNSGPVRALNVETSGSWEVTTLFPEELPVLDGNCAGNGDSAVMVNADLTPNTQGLIVDVAIHGDGLATLWAWGAAPGLLVNQLAPYTGTVVVPPGSQYLTVTSAGPWSLARR